MKIFKQKRILDHDHKWKAWPGRDGYQICPGCPAYRIVSEPDSENAQEPVSIGEAIADAISQLQSSPITVTHEIKRNIPKPSYATVIARNIRGEEYRYDVDMSWKSGVPVKFPLYFFTGRDEDRGTPIEIRIDLNYDPS